MSTGLRRLLLTGCAAVLAAQTPVPTLPQQPVQTAPAGLETDWEAGNMLKEIVAGAGRLSPALDRIDARSWVDKGASETYAEQLQSAKEQTQALISSANAMSNNPEQLSGLLDVFFRMQAIDSMLTSVEEGIGKYGNKPDIQMLVGLAAEASRARYRLQHYIVSLAAEREREFQAMDREAQRCRAVVTAPKSGKKK